MSRACVTTAFPAAALWVLLDYVRAHAGFLAFPWGTLAHTQHRNLPLLQLATITGEYGVTFMVVFGSVALAGIIFQRAWRAAAFAALVVALAHIGGAFALHAAAPGTMIRVAAVQPNIQRSEQATPEGRIAIFERLERLTQAAAAQHPSLIAWPETAIAGNLQTNPLLAADLSIKRHWARSPTGLNTNFLNHDRNLQSSQRWLDASRHSKQAQVVSKRRQPIFLHEKVDMI